MPLKACCHMVTSLLLFSNSAASGLTIMRFQLLLSFFLSFVANAQYASHSQKNAHITLPCGTLVNGLIDANSSSVRQFLGIPYAQPPVGDLRWEPPLANKFTSPVNATAYGTSCTQPEATTPSL